MRLHMRNMCLALGALVCLSLASVHAQTAGASDVPPARRLAEVLLRWTDLLDVRNGTAKTVSAEIEVLEATGFPDGVVGQKVRGAVQLPDRWRIETAIRNEAVHVVRFGEELSVWQPEKRFGLLGTPGLQRFRMDPGSVDDTRMEPLEWPLRREQVALIPLFCAVQALPDQGIGGAMCAGFRVKPLPAALAMLDIEPFELDLWVEHGDQLPRRFTYRGVNDGLVLTVELMGVIADHAWEDARWGFGGTADAPMERVALSHLTRMVPAAIDIFTSHIPALGEIRGERRVIGRHGRGRLELVDDTRVLYLAGSPEEMGEQHGVLLRDSIHDLVNRVLYGVGVGSSFEKGRWFFGEIESCQERIQPFIPARHLREMDAMARAAGLPVAEVRLANFFPELFHCSGFALLDGATRDGMVYHGRILDYLRGVGLEQNAVLMVYRPDEGNAWVNVSYAGFVGSVTAMNEKHLSIGEMGGRGEGNWDGMPMAQLVRQVMENCDTLEEAIDWMRRSPRTCEYYYVLADGKNRTAAGIAATPDRFEVIWTGQPHPQLPHSIPGTVLMSAGNRYLELVRRVETNYGQFDATLARRLMDRPVAMNSNIQSVLFAPGTLEFWVAHADSARVASEARYTRYHLGEMLAPEVRNSGPQGDVTVSVVPE